MTAPAAAPAPAAEREPDFLHAGRPVYRCRHCGDRFERIANLPAVLLHELEAHPGAPPPAPLVRVVRESSILAENGQPYLVEEVVAADTLEE